MKRRDFLKGALGVGVIATAPVVLAETDTDVGNYQVSTYTGNGIGHQIPKPLKAHHVHGNLILAGKIKIADGAVLHVHGDLIIKETAHIDGKIIVHKAYKDNA